MEAEWWGEAGDEQWGPAWAVREAGPRVRPGEGLPCRWGPGSGREIFVTETAAGEGSEREMGYISSEPSLQEFIPHQMDQDNTPPPTGNYVVIIIIVIIIITQVMRATEVLTTWQWRGCHRWRWCPCMSNTPGWRRRNPRGSSRSKVCWEGWSPQLSDCCLPTELVTVSVGVSAWAKYQVIPNTNSYLYHSLSLELLERRLEIDLSRKNV